MSAIIGVIEMKYFPNIIWERLKVSLKTMRKKKIFKNYNPVKKFCGRG